MRKSIFLTLVLSLCVAEFGANAAVAQRGNARGTNNANTNTATQSVTTNNAGTRQKVVNNGAKTTAAAVATGDVSARAGKKKNVVKPTAKTSSSVSSGVTAARAGAKQKVINTGTKVESAKENTTIPEECQDAFYGCMDAFCMLDNASGGRCQCNDKITELDAIQEDILKLDQQSYNMMNEGVERIKMGEAESEIIARAKATADKVVNGEKEEKVTKGRQLDLSIFQNNIFGEEDEDIFDVKSAQQSMLDKKGTALFNETVKLCAGQIPAQCKTYGSMLQLVYAQKIKSDCMAYENSLKGQKLQSEQKLQTAQKALRDAALDEYENQNKYKNSGDCELAFKECMQTTAGCGTDYTGCVTLAARENMTNTKAGSKKAKQTKVKGQISGADITLAASTMESLLAKKGICEKVIKQCVTANKEKPVWDMFLSNEAPAIKSAELMAEQNLRSNCIPSVTKCFTDACKAQFGDSDENYDMCLANPATYRNLCKVQLEPCLEATGGSWNNYEKSTLWNDIVALLNAMKVDACTNEIKTCLTDRCGADYSACVGLDTASIGDLCPVDKLTACVSDGKYADGKGGANTAEIRQYVAEIAQGLAVQIDDALSKVCQNAADEAMLKACGDTESCDNAMFDLGALESDMKVEVCNENLGKKQSFASACYPSVAMTPQGSLKDRDYGYHAVLQNKPDISGVSFTSSNGAISEDLSGAKKVDGKIVAQTNMIVDSSSVSLSGSSAPKSYSGNVRFYGNADKKNSSQIADILNDALDRVMTQINTDPTVVYCREGREVQGFSKKEKFGKNGSQGVRFPNLTNDKAAVVARALQNKLSAKYLELTSKFDEQIAAIDKEITELVYAEDEKNTDETNFNNCMNKNTRDNNRCFYTNTTSSKINDKDGNEIAKGNVVVVDDRGDCCCNNITRAFSYQLTENVANYDYDTNVCTVKTMKYTCVEEGHGFFWFGNRRCLKYDEGTVMNTQTFQMAKSH